MNAGRIVVIMIVTLMPIVSIMMDHMTANVKMVFMVMVISIVFLTNCAKLQNAMKMQNAPRLTDLLFVLAKKVSLVEVISFAVLYVPQVTGKGFVDSTRLQANEWPFSR